MNGWSQTLSYHPFSSPGQCQSIFTFYDREYEARSLIKQKTNLCCPVTMLRKSFKDTWGPACGVQGWTHCPASKVAAGSISGVPNVVAFSSPFQVAPVLLKSSPFLPLVFLKSLPPPSHRAPFFASLVSSAEWNVKLIHNLWSSIIPIPSTSVISIKKKLESVQNLFWRDEVRVVARLNCVKRNWKGKDQTAAASSTRRLQASLSLDGFLRWLSQDDLKDRERKVHQITYNQSHTIVWQKKMQDLPEGCSKQPLQPDDCSLHFFSRKDERHNY